MIGLVERHHQRRDRPAAHGRGVDPPGAGRGGRAARARRPARAAGVPARHRRAGRRCSTSGFDAVRIAGGGELRGTGRHGPCERRRRGPPRRARPRGAAHGHRPGSGRSRRSTGRRPTCTSVSQVMPGWARRCWRIALILPALVASVDAFARARRRGEPVLPWLRWLGAGALAVAIGLGIALRPRADRRRCERAARGAGGARPLSARRAGAVVALVAVAVVTALAWFGPALPRRSRRPGAGRPGGARRGGGDRARAGGLRAAPVAGQPVRRAGHGPGAAPVDAGDAGRSRARRAAPGC